MSEAAVATADSNAALKAIFGKPDSEGTFNGVMGTERSARVKYWRKPNGWITTGPDVMTDAPKYQQHIHVKHYQELPSSFGIEVAGVQGGKIASLARIPAARAHQWLEPFFNAGGLTYVCQPNDSFGKPGEYLMTKEQLVTYNLHRIPEVRNLRPDLAGAVDLECPYSCVDEASGKRRQFSGVDADAAQRSVDQHIVASHADAVASRAVGDTIAQQLKAMQGGAVNNETIAGIVAAVMAALNPTETKAIAQVAPEEYRQPEPEPAAMWGIGPDIGTDTEYSISGTGTDVSYASPDYTNVPAEQALTRLSDIPAETWRRSELFAWGKAHGLSFGEKTLSLKQAQVWAMVKARLAEINEGSGSPDN